MSEIDRNRRFTLVALWPKRHKKLFVAATTLFFVGVVGLTAHTVLLQREQVRMRADFVRARAAVEEMLVQFRKFELAAVPQMEEFRAAMLVKSLPLYQSFLHEHGRDRALVLESGRAATSVGDILEMLDRHDESEVAYRQAIRLIDARAARVEDRRDLATAWHRLGVLLKKADRFTEAETALIHARQLRAVLAERFPDRPELRRERNESVSQLATLLARLPGRFQEVASAYSDAIESEKALADQHPDDLEYPCLRARYHEGRGVLLRCTDVPASERECDEALRLREGLAAKAWTVPAYQWDLALSLGNRGAIEESHRAYKRASEYYGRAAERLERLAEDFPRVAEYRSELASVQNNLGVVLWKSGATADALAHLKTAVDLKKALAGSPRYAGRADYREKLARSRRQLALVLDEAGRHAEALAELEQARGVLERLVGANPDVSEYQNELGLVFDAMGRIKLVTPERTMESLSNFRHAIGHHYRAVQTNRMNLVFRQNAANTYEYIGTALERESNWPAAKRAQSAGITAEELARKLPEEPTAHFIAARLLCLAATLTTRDPSPTSNRKDWLKTYTDRALNELEEAVRQGIDSPKQLNDPAFAPIQGSERFKSLQDRLQPKRNADDGPEID